MSISMAVLFVALGIDTSLLLIHLSNRSRNAWRPSRPPVFVATLSGEYSNRAGGRA